MPANKSIINKNIKIHLLKENFSYKNFDDAPFVSFVRSKSKCFVEVIAMIPVKVNFEEFNIKDHITIGNRVKVNNSTGTDITAREIKIKWEENIKPLSGPQNVWLIQIEYEVDGSWSSNDSNDTNFGDNAAYVCYEYGKKDGKINGNEVITERGTVVTSADSTSIDNDNKKN